MPKRVPLEDLTKYERTRVIGARALQISLGAPVFIKTTKRRPVQIARQELEEGVIPITVLRPEPEKGTWVPFR